MSDAPQPEQMLEGYLENHAPVDEKRKMMTQEFAQVFEKYPGLDAAYRELGNNPDYQREAQLAKEKYDSTKHYGEFLKSLEDILCKHIPEMRVIGSELRAIEQKYGMP